MCLVVLQQGVEIDVPNSISVCHQESFVGDVIPDPFESASCQGIMPRVDERHFPSLALRAENLDRTIGQIDGQNHSYGENS